MHEEKETLQDSSCKTPRWRLLKAKLNNLKPEAFKAILATQSEIMLIDVRTPDEFASSHLEDAININYFADDFWEQIEVLNKERSYLIYCRSGRRSIRVCTLMQNGGFDPTKIFNLDGGLIEWETAYS